MTPEQWQRIERVFFSAIEREPHERPGFIREACQEDEWLQEQLMLLVSQHEKTGSFLGEPISGVRQALDAGSALESDALSPGDTLSSRFRVVRLIGKGGMGEVYEVEDLDLGEKVAAKLLRQAMLASPEAQLRFKREIQLSRRITHPNICRVYDLNHGQLPSTGTPCFFLTMELLEGETLAALLARRSRLSQEEARPLIEQMVAALRAAHAHSVVHRDFKPSNVVLVPRDGSAPRVVVTDFGLARTFATSRSTQPAVTRTDRILGTPLFMAPEQLEGKETTPSSDVYALGLVMYEMLTGVSPFQGDSPLTAAFARLWVPPASLREKTPEISEPWERIILRCLSRDPDARPRTKEVLDAIGPSPTAAPEVSSGTVRKPALWPRLRTLHWVGALALLLVALFVFGIRSYLLNGPQKGHKGLVAEVVNLTPYEDLNNLDFLLRRQLSQSERIGIMDNTEIAQTWKRMEETPISPVPMERSAELARRANASFVLQGTVSPAGAGFVLEMGLTLLGDGSTLRRPDWKREFPASNKDDLFSAVGQAADSVREFLGEAPVDLRAHNVLPQVTTASWAALSYLAQAEEEKQAGRTDGAIDLLKRAVKADPGFSLAYGRLGDLLAQQKNPESLIYWKKALDTLEPGKLTSRELYRIKGLYAFDTGDYPQGLRIFREWAEADPENDLPLFYQIRPLMVKGRVQEALACLERAHQLKPEASYTIANLAKYNLILGRFSEVERYAEILRQLGGGTPKNLGSADAIIGSLRFVEGEYGQARSLFMGLRSSLDETWQESSYTLEASLLAERGLYAESLKALEEGVSDDQRKGRNSSVGLRRVAMAYLYFKEGQSDRAKRLCEDAVATGPDLPPPTPENWMRAGSLLARMGYQEMAESYLAQIDPNARLVDFRVAQRRLTGEIALSKGDVQAAIEALREALQLDPGPYQAEAFSRALEEGGQDQRALEVIAPYIDGPGRIWHEPTFEFPGFWADLLFRGARLETARGSAVKENTHLQEYLKLRETGDESLADLREARRL